MTACVSRIETKEAECYRSEPQNPVDRFQAVVGCSGRVMGPLEDEAMGSDASVIA